MSSDPSEDKAAPSVGSAVLDQAFDGDSLYALRASVAAHAAEAGLSRQRVYDVLAAAHELAANAVRHGAAHGRLRLWADCSSLHCQVSHDSPAEQDETRPDPAAWQREHAHARWIIDQIADTVTPDHDPCGTTVTATFTVSSFG